MNSHDSLKRLIAAARTVPPSDAVPLAFEKRVMARLAAAPQMDLGLWWARLLWRASVPCVALMLMLGVWTYLVQTEGFGGSLADDLESTVLAPVAALEESW
jgi:hypothetical protein